MSDNHTAILSDEARDRELLDNGYTVIPFLNSSEIETLKEFFHTNHPEGISQFYATAHVPDIEFRKKMNSKIKEVFARAIEENFISITPLGGSFVVKPRKQEERLHPHQDWNIVDEDQYRSFNIWVPLVDLNERNGVIRVLPGSHAWTKTYRGPNIDDPFQNHIEEIWQNMKPLYMEAGSALVYDHRIFHASDPNVSDDIRLAAVYGIKPEEAQMYYYFGRDGVVEKYESSVDFFMEGDIQKGPEILKKINDLEGNPSEISEKALKRWLGKESAWERLLAKVGLK